MSTRTIKVVEGYWDCKYCQTKRIPGFKKVCPNCGHPVGENQKYYISVNEALNKQALKENEISDEEDWQCVYCNSYNSAASDHCSFCGASKKEGISYFDEKTKITASDTYQESTPYKSRMLKLFIGILLASVIFFVAINALKPSYYTLKEKSWQRTIEIEEYKTVLDNAWYLPPNATLEHTQEEIAGYNQVFSHYEQVPVTHSRDVYAGESCSTYTVDNGNGSFDVVEQCYPTYQTEYYTEYESRPVYISEPYYETKYYFYIEKWVHKDKFTLQGVNDTPTWPDYNLKENERMGNKMEQYNLVFDVKRNVGHTSKTLKCSSEQYVSIEVGETYDLQIQGVKLISFE